MITSIRVGLLVVLVLLGASSAAVARTWTSGDGKFTTEAEFVSISGGTVTLKKPDGKLVKVPARLLSAADQEFIKAQSKPQENPSGEPNASSEKEIKDALKKLGIRVISTGFMMEDEIVLSKRLRESKARTSLSKAVLEVEKNEKDIQGGKNAITELTKLNIQLNVRIGRVQGDVTLHNQLVSAITANQGRLDLVRAKIEQLQQAAKNGRANANEAREKYLQYVLELRAVATKIDSKYEKFKSDDAVNELITQLNKVMEKSYAMTPSRTYVTAMKRLKALEDSVLSESIVLEDDGSGTFSVPVIINGKPSQKMVIDTGASYISLPARTAAALGIETTAADPTIILVLADGRQIEGKLIVVESVRVGKFIVEDVDCVVLGADAVAARPILGMSFLGDFKFEVNAQQRKLKMIKIDEGAVKKKR